MDLAIVEKVVASVVSLLVPYIKMGAESFAKKGGEELGKDFVTKANNKVKELCDTIKNKFKSKETANEAFVDFEKNPEDPDLQATVRVQLKKVMREDETFAKQVAILLKEAAAVQVDTVFNTHINGDVQELVNLGTVFGTVNINQPSSNQSKKYLGYKENDQFLEFISPIVTEKFEEKTIVFVAIILIVLGYIIIMGEPLVSKFFNIDLHWLEKYSIVGVVFLLPGIFLVLVLLHKKERICKNCGNQFSLVEERPEIEELDCHDGTRIYKTRIIKCRSCGEITHMKSENFIPKISNKPLS